MKHRLFFLENNPEKPRKMAWIACIRTDAGFDDSTSIALLDIFATLALECMVSDPRSEKIQKCLRIGRDHATRLLAQDDRFAKSRPYLKWIMVKLMSQDYEERRQWKNIIFRGFGRGTMDARSKQFFGRSLPMYAIASDEAPEWKPRFDQPPKEAIKVVRMVQQAALDTGDVQMQGACLQELIWHLPEGPEAVLEELHKLWSDAGHPMEIQNIQLFKYLLARTQTARKQLRQEILTFGEYPSDDFIQYSRCMVLHALATQSHEKEVYLKRAQALSHPKIPDTARGNGREEYEETEYSSDGATDGASDSDQRFPLSRTRDDSYYPGIVREPRPSSRGSQDRTRTRVSFERGGDRRGLRDEITTVAKRTPGGGRDERLGQLKRQIDELRRDMDKSYPDEEALLARLKDKLGRLKREYKVLKSKVGDGTTRGRRPGFRPPADVNVLEDGSRFSRVDDYEGSSERVV
ncbi:hypothetical protein IMZ48_41545, partial [Candidatus Bathyarchaeota archaeon]|nr:hypothetical protein [Candidatus Bathyarchaeota archaeon]